MKITRHKKINDHFVCRLWLWEDGCSSPTSRLTRGIYFGDENQVPCGFIKVLDATDGSSTYINLKNISQFRLTNEMEEVDGTHDVA